jgi:hypothetical protein
MRQSDSADRSHHGWWRLYSSGLIHAIDKQRRIARIGIDAILDGGNVCGARLIATDPRRTFTVLKSLGRRFLPAAVAFGASAKHCALDD